MTTLLPGAEPWSHDGGPVGALCLHGFTGNPSSMRGVAEAMAEAGFSVELPLLPGHGTTVDDMMATGWHDWTAAADEAYARLAERCDQVVVAGLSMGGSLTLWIAAHHPGVKGIVCINPAAQPQPPEVMDMVHQMLDGGAEVMPGIGSDIADPDVVESAYTDTPLRPLVSLVSGVVELSSHYPGMTVPMLLVTSRQDHVVDPGQSDFLAEQYGGPVERVWLERSYHVATLDYDRDDIEQRAVAFARSVTGA